MWMLRISIIPVACSLSVRQDLVIITCVIASFILKEVIPIVINEFNCSYNVFCKDIISWGDSCYDVFICGPENFCSFYVGRKIVCSSSDDFDKSCRVLRVKRLY